MHHTSNDAQHPNQKQPGQTFESFEALAAAVETGKIRLDVPKPKRAARPKREGHPDVAAPANGNSAAQPTAVPRTPPPAATVVAASRPTIATAAVNTPAPKPTGKPPASSVQVPDTEAAPARITRDLATLEAKVGTMQEAEVIAVTGEGRERSYVCRIGTIAGVLAAGATHPTDDLRVGDARRCYVKSAVAGTEVRTPFLVLSRRSPHCARDAATRMSEPIRDGRIEIVDCAYAPGERAKLVLRWTDESTGDPARLAAGRRGHFAQLAEAELSGDRVEFIGAEDHIELPPEAARRRFIAECLGHNTDAFIADIELDAQGNATARVDNPKGMGRLCGYKRANLRTAEAAAGCRIRLQPISAAEGRRARTIAAARIEDEMRRVERAEAARGATQMDVESGEAEETATSVTDAVTWLRDAAELRVTPRWLDGLAEAYDGEGDALEFNVDEPGDIDRLCEDYLMPLADSHDGPGTEAVEAARETGCGIAIERREQLLREGGADAIDGAVAGLLAATSLHWDLICHLIGKGFCQNLTALAEADQSALSTALGEWTEDPETMAAQLSEWAAEELSEADDDDADEPEVDNADDRAMTGVTDGPATTAATIA